MGLGREVSTRKFGSIHGELTIGKLISYNGNLRIKVNRGPDFYAPQKLLNEKQAFEHSCAFIMSLPEKFLN